MRLLIFFILCSDLTKYKVVIFFISVSSQAKKKFQSYLWKIRENELEF